MQTLKLYRSRAVTRSAAVRLSRRWITSHGSSAPRDYDIVVVGGGPAGLAFANALTAPQPVRNSLSIALIETSDLNRVRQWTQPAGTYSNRVSSITSASRQFLSDIGAWQFVDDARTAPVEELQVWDGVSDSRITFSSSEAVGLQATDAETGFPALGMARLTENLNLQRALLRSLDDCGTVSVLDKVKVSAIERDTEEKGSWPLIHTSDGAVLRARLLVGADGNNSPVRAHAGIDSYGWAYDTRAIVATLFHPARTAGLQPPNTTAYQRFLPTGPIAFLPLSPTASSLVWSTKPPLAAALTSAEPEVLRHMINAAFRLPEVSVRYLHDRILEAQASGVPISASTILDEIRFREASHQIDEHSAYSSTASANFGIPPTDAELLPPLVTDIQPGTVASFPLRLSHADSYVGEGDRSRTVLLGDAAHTIHPLAGQGLNMGLADAQALADCIHAAVTVGSDIGTRTALLPYARARYFENHTLLSATDKLHKLYSSTFAPVVWARSVGLEVINELDSVKAALMQSAGGNDVQLRTHGQVRSDTPIWNLAASGVEAVNGTLNALGLVGRGLADTVATRLKNLSESYGQR